jgi:hypothetical protein
MENEKLSTLMKSEGLSRDTMFYRYTTEKHLEEFEEGKYKLFANDEATEIIEDYYKTGQLIMAKYIASGLAFTTEKDTDYKSDLKMCVEMRLSEILDQGGLVYPDPGSFETSSYFLSIPNGFVLVRKLN